VFDGADVVDVAVIGYGPIGALLANLLGQRGLSVMVIEKEADVYRLPRAVHFDGEVMRVFESAGLRAEVEAISRPGLQGMHFVNADGATLMIRAPGGADGPHGCATNYYFHQPDLEDVLRAGVTRYKNVTVKLGLEVQALEQHADEVTIRTRKQDRGEDQTWRAKYVVGCDGARSFVRKTIGSDIDDLVLDQPWLVFDVILNDAERTTLPAYTVQHCDPARPMTYCNITGQRRRWEIMLMPDDDALEMVKPDRIWPLVKRWINPSQATLERAAVYTFHSVIARGWRKQRLLIAGDAAHQMPPFLGQGMCAGVRDVSNLAWKLHAVISGTATEDLLDTYESERAPHVRAFIALAVKIGDVIQMTDPKLAAERDAKLLKGAPEVFQFPAPGLGQGFVEKNSPAAGQMFPQPRNSDDTLLDSKIGTSFALIAPDAMLNSVDSVTKSQWDRWNVKRLSLESINGADDKLVAWFTKYQTAAVILRPDRYVLGTAKDSEELERISSAFFI
jgi:3-(3-hydroxy-phenyl)propionate hydroxylase